MSVTLVAFRPGAGGPAPVTSMDANRHAVAGAEERMRYSPPIWGWPRRK